MEAQAGIDTARVAAATLFERLAEKYPIISYRNILYSYSANTLAGTLVLPFPEVTEKTYTATEVGVVLGLSANKVGRIANSLGLKHEKGTEGDYGKWFEDKSKYSNKEVETFRYNQKGIDKLKECLDLANDNEVE
jgi:hypothetical protein